MAVVLEAIQHETFYVSQRGKTRTKVVDKFVKSKEPVVIGAYFGSKVVIDAGIRWPLGQTFNDIVHDCLTEGGPGTIDFETVIPSVSASAFDFRVLLENFTLQTTRKCPAAAQKSWANIQDTLGLVKGRHQALAEKIAELRKKMYEVRVVVVKYLKKGVELVGAIVPKISKVANQMSALIAEVHRKLVPITRTIFGIAHPLLKTARWFKNAYETLKKSWSWLKDRLNNMVSRLGSADRLLADAGKGVGNAATGLVNGGKKLVDKGIGSAKSVGKTVSKWFR